LGLGAFDGCRLSRWSGSSFAETADRSCSLIFAQFGAENRFTLFQELL
jgi:hypothetical protein